MKYKKNNLDKSTNTAVNELKSEQQSEAKRLVVVLGSVLNAVYCQALIL